MKSDINHDEHLESQIAMLRHEQLHGIDEPPEGADEQQNREGQTDETPDSEENPMHALFSLKKLAWGGSCVSAVGILYFLASWDHNWIPGVHGPFAQAEDVTVMRDGYTALRSDMKAVYSLLLAKSIRDLWQERCNSINHQMLDDQIERLQITYQDRTGNRYELLPCKEM